MSLIDLLRALIGKVNNLGKMGTISRKVEILKKKFFLILKIKNTTTEISNTVDGLINNLNMAK